MRTLVLIDWNWAGHIPLHAESISRLFLQHGWAVNHICPDAKSAENHLNQVCDLGVTCHELSTHPSSHYARSKRESIEHRWRALAEVLKSLQVDRSLDFAFFPWIDLQLDHSVTPDVMPRQLDLPWGGLLLNAGDFSSSAKGFFSRRKRLRKYHSLRHPALELLVTLDELAVDRMRATFPSARVRWMPDLIEPNPRCEGASAALQTACAAGLPILLSVGVMHRRKGYLRLLEIARRGKVKNWFFLLAGKFVYDDLTENESSLVRDAIDGRFSNVAVVDQHLPSAASLNAHITAADAVFLGYEQWTQSSNIMTRASLLQTPILSCPDGILAHRTKQDDLGIVLPSLDIETIESILAGLTWESLDQLRRAANFDRFTDRHRCEAMTNTFADVLGVAGVAKPIAA